MPLPGYPPTATGPRALTYLEAARRRLRLSQKELGDHPDVRIAQDFISVMERCEGLPTPAQAARLAKVLGIAPELLGQTIELPEWQEA